VVRTPRYWHSKATGTHVVTGTNTGSACPLAVDFMMLGMGPFKVGVWWILSNQISPITPASTSPETKISSI